MNETGVCSRCAHPALRDAHLTYISETTRIVVGAVSCVVATLGVFTNLMNIVVFRCQGFQDTVNISLLALAVSDLFTLISILNFNITVMCELTDRSILPQDFSYPGRSFYQMSALLVSCKCMGTPPLFRMCGSTHTTGSRLNSRLPPLLM